MGMDEYHSHKLDKANLKAGPISCSMLKQFSKNPYSWRFGNTEFTPTAAMQTGSLFDLCLTEPDTIGDRVVAKAFDNYKTKAAQEWRDEMLAKGAIIATQAEIDHAMKAADAVRGHKVAGEILDGCRFQVGAVAEIHGIPAKCLIDIEPAFESEWGETLVDYKTTSFGLEDVTSAISKFGYHIQAAFYRSLKNTADKERYCEDFAFIFQDVNTLEVRVVKLSADAMNLGVRYVRKAVQEFARCAERGIGSRYAETVTEVGVQGWLASQQEEWIEGA